MEEALGWIRQLAALADERGAVPFQAFSMPLEHARDEPVCLVVPVEHIHAVLRVRGASRSVETLCDALIKTGASIIEYDDRPHICAMHVERLTSDAAAAAGAPLTRALTRDAGAILSEAEYVRQCIFDAAPPYAFASIAQAVGAASRK